MKSLTCISLLFVAFQSLAQSITFESNLGEVKFTYVKEKTKGTLTSVQSKVSIDNDDLGASFINGKVNVNTLSTNNSTRDKHLKAEDFFDVENFPEMSFESTSISRRENRYLIEGKLTIKNTTKSVTFETVMDDMNISLSTTIYALDFDVAVRKERTKSKVDVVIVIPIPK